MFSAEKLLGGLVQEALSSSLGVSSRAGRRSRRSYSRHRSSRSLERAIGMGLVGAAMAAYEHFTKSSDPSPAAVPPPMAPSEPTSVPPPPPGASSAAEPAVLLLRAMFAAAAADGSIDDAERTRIVERMSQAGLSTEERAFVDREMATPCSLFQLLEEVERAHADAPLREQIYFASLIAVDVDSDREREYFQGLADGLGLSAGQVEQLTERLG